ncbi:GAP family protein [Yinghuangia aomiensis]
MGDAIGQVLSPAVGVAISPVPLIAVILMLATPKGRANGAAFTIGWILSVAAAMAALIAVGAGATPTTAPRPTGSPGSNSP